MGRVHNPKGVTLLSNTDNKQARINALIEKGKKNGVLTQKELNDALSEMQISPEAYEKVLDSLEAMGVDCEGKDDFALADELTPESIDAFRKILNTFADTLV